MTQPNPTPLTIITGFLGAGKTTLLNRILNTDHGLRIAVLVNDFGAINIDSQLIVSVEGENAVTLSNGCICCTIRDDLLQETLALLDRQPPPEMIVVETSGVSDPLEVAITFKSVPQIRIESILTVIDAEAILDIDREYTILSMNQIGTADIVVINKTDLVDAAQLETVRAYVRDIIKQARILETTQGDVPLELVLSAGAASIDRLLERPPASPHVHTAGVESGHEHDHSLVFETWSWSHDEPVSYPELKRAIGQLPESIYRAKGIFNLIDEPDQRAVLQVVGRRANLILEAWGESERRNSRFVVIGAHGQVNPERLQALMDKTLASNAPKTGLHRLAGAAANWLRGK